MRFFLTLNILGNHHLGLAARLTKRLASVQPNIGDQVKLLSDKKQYDKAVELLDRFNENNISQCSNSAVIRALKACAEMRDVKRGVKLHELLAPRLKYDAFVMPSLIHFYMQCGNVQRAEQLFESSVKKTLPMFGAMMKGYVTNNMPQRAIDIFKEIKEPHEIAVVLFFNACAQLGSENELSLVRSAASKVQQHCISNPFVASSAIDAFMKCGDVKNAENLFQSLKNKTVPVYGAMMKGYMVNGLPKSAIDMFHQSTDANSILLKLYLNACAELGTQTELNLVKAVASKMSPNVCSDPHVSGSLIDAFMKCRDVPSAESVFKRITEKKIHILGSMMNGYLINDMPQKAINIFKIEECPNDVMIALFFKACSQLDTKKELAFVKDVFAKMSPSSRTNHYIMTALIEALTNFGDVSTAQTVFDECKNKTLYMYAALMIGFVKNDLPAKAIDVFEMIDRKLFDRASTLAQETNAQSPNKNQLLEGTIVIHLYLIKALAKLGFSKIARSYVEQMPSFVAKDLFIQVALIDMWGKAHCVEEAKSIFQRRSRLDHVAFNAMINSYGLNGMGSEALELYRQMPKEFKNDQTYTIILNACSHMGLVDEARSIFRDIQTEDVIVYTTMIDCLSRVGAFDEAKQLIERFERNHAPSAVMYMALLSGARNQSNSQLSEEIVARMKVLFPNAKESLTPASILLANVYASSGEMDKASAIRYELEKSGAKRKGGISMTELDGKIFKFRAHDRSHPNTAEIYETVDRISKELLKHGHQYDASWIMRPLDVDETVETVLCGHSERLAIAVHFVGDRKPKYIQITKNLRVCGDCHRVTKLIASIFECEIVVRDANRIHHFYTNGQCSCQDHF